MNPKPGSTRASAEPSPVETQANDLGSGNVCFGNSLNPIQNQSVTDTLPTILRRPIRASLPETSGTTAANLNERIAAAEAAFAEVRARSLSGQPASSVARMRQQIKVCERALDEIRQGLEEMAS